MTQNAAEQGWNGAQRLDTPLHRVGMALARVLARIAPVPGREQTLTEAIGAVAAGDIMAARAAPPYDVALIDGYALASADITGASPLSPAPLAAQPALAHAGAAIPAGADCVVPADMIVAGPLWESIGAVAPGEGIRHGGEDLRRDDLVIRSGERVDRLRAFALAACGVGVIMVRRPRVGVLAVGRNADDLGTAGLIAGLAEDAGAEPQVVATPRSREALVEALRGLGADAVFVVGGTGVGDNDWSVAALRAVGGEVAHGIALEPGTTAGIGWLGEAPVVAFPGQHGPAFATWLALGAPILRALSGASEPRVAPTGPLLRKIASSVGIAQVAPLIANGEGWRPLAVGDITLSHLARADAFLLIPEESEGCPEGTSVAPWPAPGR